MAKAHSHHPTVGDGFEGSKTFTRFSYPCVSTASRTIKPAKIHAQLGTRSVQYYSRTLFFTK